jgi:hypothetical protein
MDENIFSIYVATVRGPAILDLKAQYDPQNLFHHAQRVPVASQV